MARGEWTSSALRSAVKHIQEKKMSVNEASRKYDIPRRTLRDYLKKGITGKQQVGRRAVLSSQQEEELKKRIFRLCDVGFPLTSKALRKSVYQFVDENNLENPFNREKKTAGKDWLNGFLKRNPDISNRKSQNLNEARAQKVNHIIVDDYFTKLKEALLELDIVNKPHLIFNMDEKGLQMCRHKSARVLAQKGVRRVHNRGKEHGENVTFVAAGNAIGMAIPPMLLFKGKKKNNQWTDSLPPSTLVEMTPKGSMLASTFVHFLEHFAKFKPEGNCLLLLDGAKCHFDIHIAETAKSLGITLLCLPSNTTHELQPLDKCLFRSMEIAWDSEIDLFWELTGTRKMDKLDFCRVFNRVWLRSVTASNIRSGFEACGVYPFFPGRIPEVAFAPCAPTNIPLNEDDASSPQNQQVEKSSPVNAAKMSTSPSSSQVVEPSSGGPSTSRENWSTPSGCISTFEKFRTPDMKRAQKKVCRKSLNYKAVRIERCLFDKDKDSDSVDDGELLGSEMEISDPEIEVSEPKTGVSELDPKIKMLDSFKTGDFLVLFVVFNFGTKKELKKFYVGQVLRKNVGRGKAQTEVDLLRKIPSKEKEDTTMIGFAHGPKDVWKVSEDHIVQSLKNLAHERRGRFFFEKSSFLDQNMIFQ